MLKKILVVLFFFTIGAVAQSQTKYYTATKPGEYKIQAQLLTDYQDFELVEVSGDSNGWSTWQEMYLEGSEYVASTGKRFPGKKNEFSVRVKLANGKYVYFPTAIDPNDPRVDFINDTKPNDSDTGINFYVTPE